MPLFGGTDGEAFKGCLEGPLGLERLVLVKRSRRLGSYDDEPAEALGREARVYARLDHPALPRLVDFYVDQNRVVLLTAWVEGVPLEALLGALQASGDRLPEAAAFHLAAQLFGALAAAHGACDPVTREFAPIVHQSVSPKTITLTAQGQIVLGDFERSRTLSSYELTPSGLLGTHEGYLAPEQVQGERPSVRADVYSACLILRELLIGEPAFPHEDLDYLAWLDGIAHPRLCPVGALLPHLDPEVRWLLDVGLRPEPESRSLTAPIAAQILAPLAIAGSGQRELAEYVRRLCTSGAFPKAGAFDAETSDPTEPRRTSSMPPPLPAPRPNRVAVTSQPTPEPTVRALLPSPTFPSIERRSIQGPIVAGGLALALVAGVAAFLVAREWTTPSALERGSTVVAQAAPTHVAPPEPAPSASPSVPPPPLSGLVDSTTTSKEQVARFFTKAGLTGVFTRCFGPDDRPHNGLTLRARCKGGPTITVLVVQPSHGPVRHLAAYAEVPLDGKGWGKDPRALLYSFDRDKVFPVRHVPTAVDNRNPTFGPTFGAGHDLHVGPSLLRGMSGPRSFLLVANEADIVGHFGFFRVEQLEVFRR